MIGNTVDTISLYTLTPGATSSFRAIRVCTELCPKSDLDFVLKPMSKEDDDEPLVDPFIVFSENGSISLTSYCSMLLYLALFAFAQ